MSNPRFTFLGIISKNKNAMVLRAIDNETKTEVVVKRTSIPLGETEVENLLKLQEFDFIPRYITHYTDEYSLYLVEELIMGKTLYEEFAEVKSWDFVWMILYYILLMIGKLHGRGYAHGDLYYSNVIWTGTETVLIDFESLTDVNGVDLTKLVNKGLKYRFCDDYVRIFDQRVEMYLKQLLTKEARNDNHGKEKYEALKRYIFRLNCEDDTSTGTSYNDMYQLVMKKYEELDP